MIFILRLVTRGYNHVIVGLAIVAGSMVAGVFVAIVYDVLVRTLGFQPPFWTSALTEYALLYMTILAAPWVLRNKGHVFVESLTSSMPAWMQGIVEKFVYILCIVICLGLAYYATLMGVDVALRGEEDIRSIIIPKWVIFAGLPVGFVLTAVESMRFLLGKESMYPSRGGKSSEGA